VQAAGVNWSEVERFIDIGGVRIEDNVLLTQSGHFNLTMATGLPKTVAGIEAAMAESRALNRLRRVGAEQVQGA
jgi:Xaa-Pro aminopeptidase